MGFLYHLARQQYAAWVMEQVDPTSDEFLKWFHIEREAREAIEWQLK